MVAGAGLVLWVDGLFAWVFYLFWFFALGIVWFGDLFVGFGRCWGFCFGHGVVDCRGWDVNVYVG